MNHQWGLYSADDSFYKLYKRCYVERRFSLLPKILIVDDDPHIRELVSVFLEREGFQTYEAIDGLDALQK